MMRPHPRPRRRTPDRQEGEPTLDVPSGPPPRRGATVAPRRMDLRGLTPPPHSRRFRPLPSIMMSGQATREEASLAIAEGVFQFLRKPLDLDNLRGSMELLIQHHFGPYPEDLR